MNGFTHAILSLMLSWIRALINNVWSLITSEDGGVIYQFLSRNWLRIVLALCAFGILADLIIYFFRWRPDYIWKSRWRRRARRSRTEFPEEPADIPFEQPEPVPAAPTMAYAPVQQPTAVYAPAAQPTRFYAPVQDLEEPVFDEEDSLWEDGGQLAASEWEPLQTPAFGSPRPEPIDHYHHVQAGFARPVAPEQLYAPSPSYQSSVHPGLDEDAFRQNIGLTNEADGPSEHAVPVMRAPAFKPFTVVDETPVRAENPFARFAKRARTLVGMEDEDSGPTIRDLQSTVDVSQAFHAPVYPQPMNHHKEG